MRNKGLAAVFRAGWVGLALGLLFAAAGPGEAAEPYRIGYVTDLSGPFRDMYTPGLEGFTLYVKALNDRGGIGGHPVQLDVRDDEFNAERATVRAQELIQREGVNSIWGLSVSGTHAAVHAVGSKFKVPVIAQLSGIDAMAPPAKDFYYGAGTLFTVVGVVSGKLAAHTVPKPDGVVAVCAVIETPGGIALCDRYNNPTFRAQGFTVADTVFFPPPTTEFRAIAEKIARLNPGVVTVHPAAFQSVALLRELRAGGYKGAYIITNLGLDETAVVEAMKAGGFMEKTYIISRFQMLDDQGPELDIFRAAAKRYGTRMRLSAAHVMGWAGGYVMEEALKRCGFPCPGPKLTEALQGLTVNMGRLTGGPVQYTAEDHYGPSWWRLYVYEPGKQRYSAVTDWVRFESRPQITK